MRFTDKNATTYSPVAGKQYEVRDATGLVLRVSPGGTRTWLVLYQIDGRRRRFRLGTTDGLSAKEAREAMAVVRGQVAQGRDPADELQRERLHKASEPTVDELADLYLQRWAKPRKRSWSDDERRLSRHVRPRWGEKKASDIRRSDVIELLNSLVDQGLSTGANRVLAVIRRLFNWAIEQDILETSPCLRVKPPARERARQRVLSDSEIRVLWERLDECSMSPSTRCAIRVQLASALRIGEVVGASRREIDFDAGWWTIPAERSKNREAHRVPLTGLLRSLLEDQWTTGQASEWVFPSPTGNRPMTTQAVSKALFRNREVIGIREPFVPHDLRRTAASGLARAGVSMDVIARVLNHRDRSVTATYVKHGFDGEKREGLEKWARHVEGLLKGKVGNVNSA